MTTITYQATTMPPLEMWVEGNTARDYEGFDLVEYEPPPGWLTGSFSGRAKIRKQGGPTVHRWSPELVALNKAVTKAIERNTPPLFGAGLQGHKLRSSTAFSNDHHRLYSGDLDYHGTLMRPNDGDALEDVQSRVVNALRELSGSSTTKKSQKAWKAIADLVERWSYKEVYP